MYRPVLRAVRLLYDIIQSASDTEREVLTTLHDKVKGLHRRSARTPLHVVQTECRALGWTWASWSTIRIRTGSVAYCTLDLAVGEWNRHAHVLREGIRYHIWRTAPAPGDRYDMQGIGDCLDYDRTRAPFDSTMTFFDRGVLRTILAGALVTPARLVAGGRLAPEEAICSRCTAGMRETLGHAAWQCPGRHGLRQSLGLADFDAALHPRCTTRCGLIRKYSMVSDDTVKNIHKLLIAVAKQMPLLFGGRGQ
jgi:hypothetical protein